MLLKRYILVNRQLAQTAALRGESGGTRSGLNFYSLTSRNIYAKSGLLTAHRSYSTNSSSSPEKGDLRTLELLLKSSAVLNSPTIGGEPALSPESDQLDLEVLSAFQGTLDSLSSYQSTSLNSDPTFRRDTSSEAANDSTSTESFQRAMSYYSATQKNILQMEQKKAQGPACLKVLNHLVNQFDFIPTIFMYNQAIRLFCDSDDRDQAVGILKRLGQPIDVSSASLNPTHVYPAANMETFELIYFSLSVSSREGAVIERDEYDTIERLWLEHMPHTTPSFAIYLSKSQLLSLKCRLNRYDDKSEWHKLTEAFLLELENTHVRDDVLEQCALQPDTKVKALRLRLLSCISNLLIAFSNSSSVSLSDMMRIHNLLSWMSPLLSETMVIKDAMSRKYNALGQFQHSIDILQPVLLPLVMSDPNEAYNIASVCIPHVVEEEAPSEEESIAPTQHSWYLYEIALQSLNYFDLAMIFHRYNERHRAKSSRVSQKHLVNRLLSLSPLAPDYRLELILQASKEIRLDIGEIKRIIFFLWDLGEQDAVLDLMRMSPPIQATFRYLPKDDVQSLIIPVLSKMVSGGTEFPLIKSFVQEWGFASPRDWMAVGELWRSHQDYSMQYGQARYNMSIIPSALNLNTFFLGVVEDILTVPTEEIQKAVADGRLLMDPQTYRQLVSIVYQYDSDAAESLLQALPGSFEDLKSTQDIYGESSLPNANTDVAENPRTRLPNDADSSVVLNYYQDATARLERISWTDRGLECVKILNHMLSEFSFVPTIEMYNQAIRYLSLANDWQKALEITSLLGEPISSDSSSSLEGLYYPSADTKTFESLFYYYSKKCRASTTVDLDELAKLEELYHTKIPQNTDKIPCFDVFLSEAVIYSFSPRGENFEELESFLLNLLENPSRQESLRQRCSEVSASKVAQLRCSLQMCYNNLMTSYSYVDSISISTMDHLESLRPNMDSLLSDSIHIRDAFCRKYNSQSMYQETINCMQPIAMPLLISSSIDEEEVIGNSIEIPSVTKEWPPADKMEGTLVSLSLYATALQRLNHLELAFFVHKWILIKFPRNIGAGVPAKYNRHSMLDGFFWILMRTLPVQHPLIVKSGMHLEVSTKQLQSITAYLFKHQQYELLAQLMQSTAFRRMLKTHDKESLYKHSLFNKFVSLHIDLREVKPLIAAIGLTTSQDWLALARRLSDHIKSSLDNTQNYDNKSASTENLGDPVELSCLTLRMFFVKVIDDLKRLSMSQSVMASPDNTELMDSRTCHKVISIVFSHDQETMDSLIQSLSTLSTRVTKGIPAQTADALQLPVPSVPGVSTGALERIVDHVPSHEFSPEVTKPTMQIPRRREYGAGSTRAGTLESTVNRLWRANQFMESLELVLQDIHALSSGHNLYCDGPEDLQSALISVLTYGDPSVDYAKIAVWDELGHHPTLALDKSKVIDAVFTHYIEQILYHCPMGFALRCPTTLGRLLRRSDFQPSSAVWVWALDKLLVERGYSYDLVMPVLLVMDVIPSSLGDPESNSSLLHLGKLMAFIASKGAMCKWGNDSLMLAQRASGLPWWSEEASSALSEWIEARLEEMDEVVSPLPSIKHRRLHANGVKEWIDRSRSSPDEE